MEKRNVRRSAGGRNAIVRSYNSRKWYQLADWLADYLVQNAGWGVLILVLLLTPVAFLALVLGAHSLPLEYLGIPALDSFTYGSNGFGITGIVLLVEFVLLALAIRPLFRHQKKGWYLVLTAALVHFADSALLQHAYSSGFMVLVLVYIYWQVNGRLEA